LILASDSICRMKSFFYFMVSIDMQLSISDYAVTNEFLL
jgi:hypothetical protein